MLLKFFDLFVLRPQFSVRAGHIGNQGNEGVAGLSVAALRIVIGNPLKGFQGLRVVILLVLRQQINYTQLKKSPVADPRITAEDLLIFDRRRAVISLSGIIFGLRKIRLGD